jgi:predicted MPP superfamily phosphohydrolase
MKIFLRILSLVFIIIGGFGAFLAFNNSDALNISYYNYISNKVGENFANFKIAQLSDLHNHSLDYSNRNLISSIKEIDPDIVLLTGDFVDTHTKDLSSLRTLLDGLTDYPLYFVSGNHEAYAPLTDSFLSLYSQYSNANILTDKVMNITIGEGSINLFGLHDPYYDQPDNLYIEKNYGKLDETLSKLVQDAPTASLSILLSHRPEIIDLYANYKMDVVFSGHTHGGQINIGNCYPFVVNQIFPKYVAGEYYYEGTTMYVSRGLGYSAALPVRLNCDAEIVVTTLLNK